MTNSTSPPPFALSATVLHCIPCCLQKAKCDFLPTGCRGPKHFHTISPKPSEWHLFSINFSRWRKPAIIVPYSRSRLHWQLKYIIVVFWFCSLMQLKIYIRSLMIFMQMAPSFEYFTCKRAVCHCTGSDYTHERCARGISS